MITPLPVAKALFAFMTVLFVFALIEGNAFLTFYTVVALSLAGYLYGAAVENEGTRSRR